MTPEELLAEVDARLAAHGAEIARLLEDAAVTEARRAQRDRDVDDARRERDIEWRARRMEEQREWQRTALRVQIATSLITARMSHDPAHETPSIAEAYVDADRIIAAGAS